MIYHDHPLKDLNTFGLDVRAARFARPMDIKNQWLSGAWLLVSHEKTAPCAREFPTFRAVTKRPPALAPYATY